MTTETKWATIFKAEAYLRSIEGKAEFTMLRTKLDNLYNELQTQNSLTALDTDENYRNFVSSTNPMNILNNLLGSKVGEDFAKRILLFRP